MNSSKIEGATFDSQEVRALIQELAFAGYTFKDTPGGKVSLILPDGLQIDRPSLSDAIRTAMRRIYWRTKVAETAIRALDAHREFKSAVKQLEEIEK